MGDDDVVEAADAIDPAAPGCVSPKTGSNVAGFRSVVCSTRASGASKVERQASHLLS
jgi:hypothetical protein